MISFLFVNKVPINWIRSPKTFKIIFTLCFEGSDLQKVLIKLSCWGWNRFIVIQVGFVAEFFYFVGVVSADIRIFNGFVLNHSLLDDQDLCIYSKATFNLEVSFDWTNRRAWILANDREEFKSFKLKVLLALQDL